MFSRQPFGELAITLLDSGENRSMLIRVGRNHRGIRRLRRIDRLSDGTNPQRLGKAVEVRVASRRDQRQVERAVGREALVITSQRPLLRDGRAHCFEAAGRRTLRREARGGWLESQTRLPKCDLVIVSQSSHDSATVWLELDQAVRRQQTHRLAQWGSRNT